MNSVNMNTAYDADIINAIQGDTFHLRINWTDTNGNPVDVNTGYTWVFEVFCGSRIMLSFTPTWADDSSMLLDKSATEMKISARTYQYRAVRTDGLGVKQHKLFGVFKVISR